MVDVDKLRSLIDRLYKYNDFDLSNTEKSGEINLKLNAQIVEMLYDDGEVVWLNVEHEYLDDDGTVYTWEREEPHLIWAEDSIFYDGGEPHNLDFAYNFDNAVNFFQEVLPERNVDFSLSGSFYEPEWSCAIYDENDPFIVSDDDELNPGCVADCAALALCIEMLRYTLRTELKRRRAAGEGPHLRLVGA